MQEEPYPAPTEAGKFIARVLSVVFNPFFMPTLGLWVMMEFIPGTAILGERLKLVIFTIVITTSCILPLLFILVSTLNLRNSIFLIRKKDRVLPYFFTAFSIFLGSQLLSRLPVPNLFRVYLLSISLILVLLFFVSLKWKISGHTAGIGLVTGTALSLLFRYGIDLFWPVVVLILFAGIVGTARLFLGQQTLGGVIAGFFIACLSIYLILFFL
jgi:hypothetical protein